MKPIIIQNATEGNLKGITVEIPKEKLVVFTGVSGSGKSTLLIDVLYNECQRQYLEAMSFQGIHKPKVERIKHASPAIVISQTDQNKNPRSTVGTMTDIYTDLRMIYEKLSIRECPNCGKMISVADSKEEVEKKGDQFKVYMYCPNCNHKMYKLTRSYFSFNTKEGACPDCEGLGNTIQIDPEKVVDETLSLEEGAINFWEQRFGEYQISSLYQAFRYYGLNTTEKMTVQDFTEVQKEILYYGVESAEVKKRFPNKKPPKTVLAGKFEGVYSMLWRKVSEQEGDSKLLDNYFNSTPCSSCHGERLNNLSRSVTVNKTRLPELSTLSLEKLVQWIYQLEVSLEEREKNLVGDYLLDSKTKLERFLNVGVGYLTLDRQIISLSGGELQRMRLAGILDSDLSGVIYIMDEPTVGLHPKDTSGMITILKKIRDAGNSVLVIEHDQDVIQEADYIIDIGPGAGKHGGEVVGQGTLLELKRQLTSTTGQYFNSKHIDKHTPRKSAETAIHVKKASKFNLKQIEVKIPKGCLTAVIGPSGSGKSTLVFELIAKGEYQGSDGVVIGGSQFDKILEIGQSPITKMRRSNIVTYTGIYDGIRQVFSNTDKAKTNKFSAKYFSFNTSGGRCDNCEGLGYITSNMLFFKDIEVICPICEGKRFKEEVLKVRYNDLSISDVLDLSVEEAITFFNEYSKIKAGLQLLFDVGLGYLSLGQSITTLSGGECQRLKLAKELISSKGKNNLYLLDEPTTGLHPIDVEHFLVMIDYLVDAGNTVVVVEHNQQLINHCDYVIELGPGGGDKGGELVFTGISKK